MRYRKIDPRIWNDEKFHSLSNHAQFAFLFVLTHPSMTSLGAMRGSIPGLAAELGLPEKAFREAFEEVLAKGLLEHDEKASFVAAPKFMKYNAPESPNVFKAWDGALDLIPECPLKVRLFQRVKDFAEGLSEAFREALPEAFAKAMPNQEQEPEQEQEPRQEGSGEKSARTRAAVRPQLTPEALKEKWNGIPGINSCKAIGPTIKTTIRARLKEHPEADWWDKLFQQIGASDFLCGRKNGRDGPFIASLDWVLKPKNLDKIRAGNYDGGGTTDSQTCQKRIQQPGDQFLHPCGKPQSGYSSNSKPLCAEHLKEHEHDRHAQSPSA